MDGRDVRTDSSQQGQFCPPQEPFKAKPQNTMKQTGNQKDSTAGMQHNIHANVLFTFYRHCHSKQGVAWYLASMINLPGDCRWSRESLHLPRNESFSHKSDYEAGKLNLNFLPGIPLRKKMQESQVHFKNTDLKLQAITAALSDHNAYNKKNIMSRLDLKRYSDIIREERMYLNME